jgi:hypothetical protein
MQSRKQKKQKNLKSQTDWREKQINWKSSESITFRTKEYEKI